MELPIQQSRRSLQGSVGPIRTVGTAQRVPHVGNTDDRQTAAAGQHWTGVHRLSSLLSDLRFTTIKCDSIVLHIRVFMTQSHFSYNFFTEVLHKMCYFYSGI